MLQRISDTQWQFQLGLFQHMTNPLWKILLEFITVLFCAYGASSYVNTHLRLYVFIGIVTCAFFMYITFHKMKQARLLSKGVSNTVIVGHDMFSLNKGEIIENTAYIHNIPYIHIAKIGHGVFGCSLITLISGHTFVLPCPIADQIALLRAKLLQEN